MIVANMNRYIRYPVFCFTDPDGAQYVCDVENINLIPTTKIIELFYAKSRPMMLLQDVIQRLEQQFLPLTGKRRGNELSSY